MSNWNRVWHQDGCGCPSTCYNFVGNANDPARAILNEFPLSIQTVAEAMHLFATSLANRLGVTAPVVKSTGDFNATLLIQMSPRVDDTATVLLQFGAIGSYPVTGVITYRNNPRRASFGSLVDLQDWLVFELVK